IYGTLLNGVEGTAMGSFRSFDAPTLKALIGALRALDRREVSRRDWRPRSGNAKRGGDLFARRCAPCHGVRPEGRRAPTIQDPHFIGMASDSFLTASIVRRHDRSREEVRRGPDEVADLVAYLRSLGAVLESEGRN
ncbi:MAG: c-type cytochrome, partial [Gemmatimonadales bacterium]